MISAPSLPPAAPAPAAAPPAAGRAVPASPRRRPRRRSGDTLGLAWICGRFEAAVFHRHQPGGRWTSPEPVLTLDQFARALSAALEALAFAGAETFLVLEHDEFVHQSEVAPAFSEEAAQAYLKGWIQRYEREHERVVWLGERMHTGRQDSSYVLHLLPYQFYDRLNHLLLDRHLDLTRLLPLAVPLQAVLGTLPVPPDQPVLLAAEAGSGTMILVARPAGESVFARIIRASGAAEPARVGAEINRSLLYAKQQFGIAVEHVWLLSGDAVAAETRARCRGLKEIACRELTPADWLQAIFLLPAKHPVNLVAGYLRRHRRQEFVRRVLLAACWLALVLAALDAYTRRESERAERARFAALSARAPALLAEHARLAQRSGELERSQALVQALAAGRLPPVPSQFLRFLTAQLPPEVRLSVYTVKFEGPQAGWSFHLEGTADGDAEAGGDLVGALEQRLTRSPLRVRLNNGARALAPLPPTGAPGSGPAQHFILEGVLLEN